MNTTPITLHGRVYHMPDNMRVLDEVDARVCDPLKVLTAAGKAGGSMSALPITQKQCIDLLTIGVRHSGSTQDTDDQIRESIYQLGAAAYVPLAVVYLSALCGSNVATVKSPPKAVAGTRRK